MSASPDDELALHHLKETLDTVLERQALHKQRIERGERQRVVIFWVEILTLVTVLALAVWMAFFQVARSDTREFYNHRLEQLVCSVPPGSVVGDELRAQYKCGKYTPPTGYPAVPRSEPNQ